MGSETDAGCQLVPDPDSGDGSDEGFVVAFMSTPGMFMPDIFWSEFWARESDARNDKAAIKRLTTFFLTC